MRRGMEVKRKNNTERLELTFPDRNQVFDILWCALHGIFQIFYFTIFFVEDGAYKNPIPHIEHFVFFSREGEVRTAMSLFLCMVPIPVIVGIGGID